MNDNIHPLVSIITPTYNSEDFVAETIEAIQAQTYPDWELLITDDCSTDRTRDIVQAYADKDERIRLFVLEKNSGAGVARNNSLEQAQGRYIAFCDSDDRWTPEKLEKQVDFMRANDYAFTFTSYHTCDESGNVNGIVSCRRKETYSSLTRDDKIGCLTAMYDSEKIGKIPFPSLRKRQDWGMKLLALKKCGTAYGIQEPLALYRLRTGSISRNKLSLIKYNVAVYEEVLGWGRGAAHLYFFTVFMPTYICKKIIHKINNIRNGF